MSTMNLMEAAYNLAVAADRTTDSAVHEEIAQIVKLHAKIAVASAWIPIPGADFAALAANTWTMYVRINKKIDVPFSENLLKSLAAGIGTNLLSSLPILAVSSLLKSFPGIGTITGGVIMSASVYAVTIAAGVVYMKALAMLLNQSSEFTEVNLKAAVDSIMQNKSAVNQILTEANKDYQAAKASGELDN